MSLLTLANEILLRILQHLNPVEHAGTHLSQPAVQRIYEPLLGMHQEDLEEDLGENNYSWKIKVLSRVLFWHTF